MSKVKLDVLRPWMTARIIQLLGFEDDVLVDFICNQLEESTVRPVISCWSAHVFRCARGPTLTVLSSWQEPNGKKIQLNATGFLHAKKAREFMSDLWKHLLSAAESADGIGRSLIENKSKEIARERVSVMCQHRRGLLLPCPSFSRLLHSPSL